MRVPGFHIPLETIERRVGKYFSILGATLSVANFFIDKSRFAETTREAIYASSLVFVTIGGLCLFLATRASLWRKAKYADALATLREAIAPLMLKFHEEPLRNDSVHAALQKCVDRVAAAYTDLSGTTCRCCVKIVRISSDGQCELNQDGGTVQRPIVHLWAKTLCRSGDSSVPSGMHQISANTDFNQLWQDKSKKWFFGPNLPAMAEKGRYNNSSDGWRDSYRATMVWPIRHVFAEPAKTADLIGFLCIDSKKVNVFSEELDYPIGALVADVLYPFLKEVEADGEPGAGNDTVSSTEKLREATGVPK